MMALSPKRASLVALFTTWYVAHASEFLRQRSQVTTEFVEQTLMEELASSANSGRLAAIQLELGPMYASLPKNKQGQLEPSTVRYALHRYFVHKHGWYVNGLSPKESSLTNSSSTAIVADLAPAYIQGLLEKRLHHTGMQLEDLAVFAATLSDLIHNEGVKNLHAVYEILGYPTGGDVTLPDFNLALRGYLSTLIVGFDAKVTNAGTIRSLEVEARDVYAEYDDLLMWVEDTRIARDFMGRSHRNPFQAREGISPEQADELMYDLYHQFGGLNKLECSALKSRLVADEYPDTGRVSLARFYADKENLLHEAVDYIRNMGALDEAIPGSPSVIIPNYISGPSRCMPFSNYFSVCCPDDCESVLGHIEEMVAEPSVDPRRLAEIVSSTPSETQDAPRNLSTTLITRLGEIAARHEGQVPLHGRLFNQWLHHAYPRECPFPHVSGTISPVTQDEWIVMHDDIEDVLATESEKDQHATSHVHDLASLGPLPWVDVEELVALDTSDARTESRSYLRSIVMVVAVLSFAVPLVRSSAVFLGSQPVEKAQTHLV